LKPFLLTLVLVMASLPIFSSRPSASGPLEPEFRKNELIVKVDSAAALADAARVVDIERTDEIDRELPEWRKITLTAGVDLDSAIKRLERVGGIAHVERNYIYRASSTGAARTGYDYVPTEKSFKDQWALFNFGQKVGGIPAQIGADIGILAAWNHRPGVKDAAKNIIVAVTDSGITLDLRIAPFGFGPFGA
jgi:hypothetical protein